MAFYLGLDLGGTNIKAGVVDVNGESLSHASIPTPVSRAPREVIDATTRVADQVIAQANLTPDQVTAFGLGSPGMLDFDRGLVMAAPNLPGWNNVPLRDQVSRKLRIRGVLENDANCAAFGEYWAGVGRDRKVRNLVMLTLGTGVGSGVIVDGQVVHGGFNLGGEAGHMIVQPDGDRCGCGQRGCLEAYASASHAARRATEAIRAGESSTLSARLADGEGTITSEDVFNAAKAGDALSLRIVNDVAKYLGIACINFCRVLDPQMIVFAGGMILAGDFLFERVRAEFVRRDWKVVKTQVQIVPSMLGNDAGYVGAAAVAADAHQRGVWR